jgi:magnesium transporter
VTIRTLLSRADGSDETVRLDQWAGQRVGRNELLWVDLEDPSDSELRVVERALRLGPAASAALRRASMAPVARVHDDAVEVIVNTLPQDVASAAMPLEILLGDGWIVTRHGAPSAFLDDYRERIQDQRETGRMKPVEFLIVLLDTWVDTSFRASEALERAVDELDDAALRTERDLLGRLVGMRRRIAHLRRILVPHREILAELARPDFLPERHRAGSDGLVSVLARLDRAADAVGQARDMLLGTFDVHMTRTAQRTNDVMRVLTLASVILLPAVVIAGVMGMNFKVAFFDNPNTFFVVIGLMLALAVGTLAFAKWRGWL